MSGRSLGQSRQVRNPGARLFTVYRAEHAERVLITNQDNYRTQPEALLTLRPRGGLPMRLRRR
jgi:hypothetical protein